MLGCSGGCAGLWVWGGERGVLKREMGVVVPIHTNPCRAVQCSMGYHHCESGGVHSMDVCDDTGAQNCFVLLNVYVCAIIVERVLPCQLCSTPASSLLLS